MRLLIGLLLFVCVAEPSWAKGSKAPPGKGFMEVYSDMVLVRTENDFVGHQAVVLHVIRSSGEESRVLWQEGGGGLFVPQLLTPEKRGDAWVIHTDNGDWILRVSEARIDATSPGGQHEVLRRIRTLN